MTQVLADQPLLPTERVGQAVPAKHEQPGSRYSRL